MTQIDLQAHFSKKEQVFFDAIKPYLNKEDTVLKIGNGFGYLSTYIAAFVDEISIYEIEIFDKTINKKQVNLYDGKNLPVATKSFDVAVFNLVLHHIPDKFEYLKQVISKTRREIILYEQTYDNIFQKVQLVWRDWYINLKAGTPCRIYWKGYFKRHNIEAELAAIGLTIMVRKTKRSHSYYKELLILKIQN